MEILPGMLLCFPVQIPERQWYQMYQQGMFECMRLWPPIPSFYPASKHLSLRQHATLSLFRIDTVR